jgi:membrane associated rhomboid family serine protease
VHVPSARNLARMIPLSDDIRAQRFPIVNVALIAANFAVWILYELPHLESSVVHASFYPCSVAGTCDAPEPWPLGWLTSIFMHGGWDHILGNMLFLAVFGKNVEDALGRLRYLAFYLAGGFVATMTQTVVSRWRARRPTRRSRSSGPVGPSPRCSARTTCSIRTRES